MELVQAAIWLACATDDTADPCIQSRNTRTRPDPEPHGTCGCLVGCSVPAAGRDSESADRPTPAQPQGGS